MHEIKIYADPDILLRVVADEYLLIPVGEAGVRIHGMISLTESGALLWRALSEPKSAEELIELILSEYCIDRETAERDVMSFISKMKNVGIVRDAA